MTEYWRCLGLETHEEAVVEQATACSMCGRLLASGLCGCTDPHGAQAPQRVANINPSFAKICKNLSKTNTDVHVKWLDAEPVAEDAAQVPPESAMWESVPRHRGGIAMTDIQRIHCDDRSPDAVSCKEKVLRGRCTGLAFTGNPPLARVLADQFAFAMRSLGKSAVWDSEDHSDGYLVIASEGRKVFAEALHRAAMDVKDFRDQLQHFLEQRRPLSLNSLSPLVDSCLSLGVEVGGTLQLQTSHDRMKQVAIGIVSYAHSAQRAHRAFLVEASNLEMLPLKNPSCAPKESCNEEELRSEFQRNVLGYLYLATTLVTLPLRRAIINQSGSILEAELRLDTGCAHIAASHIYVGETQVFYKDVVLGANPYTRGWCLEKRLPLKFLLHRARVEHYPTAWADVSKLAEELKAVSGPSPELAAKLDASLTSSMPAMNCIDYRPVFEIQVRDLEAYKKLDTTVCGYGVLDGHLTKEKLAEVSQMHCVGCRDCIRYFERDDKTVQNSIQDIEDMTVSASSYFHRADAGNRRRLFEQPGSKRPRTPFPSDLVSKFKLTSRLKILPDT